MIVYETTPPAPVRGINYLIRNIATVLVGDPDLSLYPLNPPAVKYNYCGNVDVGIFITMEDPPQN
jgi:hypothetical protein